jgi:4-amino-4-deoxy-L-arabinose transferase-like glycosyltransferase
VVTAALRNYRRLICPGLALVLYLSGLGRPALWEPDEGRYAEIAREMIVDHDYITPRNDFVRYFEKPPLVYWVTAGSLRVFGQNEFAVRLPAAIASVGQVAITCALGDRMFGATAGMLGALALTLSPLFFAFARFATPDPLLAFFLTAAMACFYTGAQSPGFPDGIDDRWMLGAAAMLAFGTLSKGPVALVLGGAVAMLWLFWEGRSRDALRLPWLKCIGLYLGLTLPWFLLVAWRNPGFLHFFIIHEHLERYLKSTEHGWGSWFYVPVAIGGTWPWVYFTSFALTGSGGWLLGLGRSERRAAGTTDRGSDCEGPALRFLVIWFAVVFLFFSIPRSKLGEYILPALPPIGILAGRGLLQLDKIAIVQKRRLFAVFAAINAAAAISIAVAVMFSLADGLNRAIDGDAMIIAGALLAGGLTPLLFGGSKSETWMIALSISVIAGMGAGIDARKRVAPLVSYRNLAKIVTPYAHHGCKLMSYRHFEQALPFYIGARETLVNYRGELEPFGPLQDPNGDVFATTAQLQKTWGSEQCTVLVANRLDLPLLTNLLSPMPILIGREGKKLALCNRRLTIAAPVSGQQVTSVTKDRGGAKAIGSGWPHL